MIPSAETRRLPSAPLRAALAALLAIGACVATPPSHAQGAAAPAAASAPALVVRPEFQKLFVEAQEAQKGNRIDEALAKLAAAEALPNLSSGEGYVVVRTRAALALAKSDQATALQSLTQAIASPHMAEAERPEMRRVAISLALNLKDYAQARTLMETQFAALGDATPAPLRALYPQVLIAAGDHAAAVTELQRQIAADEAAGRPVAEETLRRLAGSQNQLRDEAGYAATVVKLAQTTGKAEYWNEVVARIVQKPGFAQDRLTLDVYRLKQALGLPLSPSQLGDMAYRAQQAGLPAESQKILDDGFAAGVLGKDANAAADRKMRDGVTKTAQADRAGFADSETSARRRPDGQAMVSLGMAASAMGMHDKATSLVEAGIAKGGLKQPEDAMLQLGLAQMRAGRTADAIATFAKVQGGDGSADLARAWAAWLMSPARASK